MPIFVTVICLVALLSFIDLRDLIKTARLFSVETTIGVFVSLVASALFAALRIKYITQDVGHRLGFRDSLVAMSSGQLAGAVAFQFFGQIAARSMVLNHRGISLPANIAIVSYERLVALAVSGLGAIAGALLLFGQIVPNPQQGFSDLARLALGLCLVIPFALYLGCGDRIRAVVLPYFTAQNVLAFARNFAVTVIIQLFTLAAYFFAARSLAPQVPTSDIIAASLVIMFAASVPISFAGWGVREISAAFVLTAVGIPTTQAIAISILIGVLALAAVFAIAGATSLYPSRRSGRLQSRTYTGFDAVSFICWTIPLGIAVFIVFQLHIPTSTGRLNVNAADVLAVLALPVLLYLVWTAGAARWRLSYFPSHLLAATVVILAALLHGWISFGFSEWAFFNKTIGWMVLLGYLCAGALVVRHAQQVGQSTVILTFVSAVVAVCLFDLAIVTLRLASLPVPFARFPVDGFSQNRNSFSFLLVMALCCAPFVHRWRAAFIGVLMLSAWAAGSRAGLTTFGIILFLAWFRSAVTLREILQAFALSIGGAVFWHLLPAILQSDDGVHGILAGLAGGEFSAQESNAERLHSLEGGWSLFLENPVVGAGLGAFTSWEIKTFQGDNLVIHSTPIWLLAEMGLIGLLIFALLPLRILVQEWRSKDAVGTSLILICAAFGMMSIAHEMMYQRSLWFLLGIFMALPVQSKPALTRA